MLVACHIFQRTTNMQFDQKWPPWLYAMHLCTTAKNVATSGSQMLSVIAVIAANPKVKNTCLKKIKKFLAGIAVWPPTVECKHNFIGTGINMQGD